MWPHVADTVAKNNQEALNVVFYCSPLTETFAKGKKKDRERVVNPNFFCWPTRKISHCSPALLFGVYVAGLC
jgi:hypothetical protein